VVVAAVAGVEGAAAGVLGDAGLVAPLVAGGEIVGVGCVLSCAPAVERPASAAARASPASLDTFENRERR